MLFVMLVRAVLALLVALIVLVLVLEVVCYQARVTRRRLARLEHQTARLEHQTARLRQMEERRVMARANGPAALYQFMEEV